jgi:hypothetical protein
MEGMPFEGVTGERLRKALLVMVILLAVFLAAEVLNALARLILLVLPAMARQLLCLTLPRLTTQ